MDYKEFKFIEIFGFSRMAVKFRERGALISITGISEPSKIILLTYTVYELLMKLQVLLMFFAGVLAFTMASAAPYIQIIGPVNKTLYNGQSVYLGNVGPGESFYVLASPNTTDNGNYINIGWDTLRAVNMSGGWSSLNSPLYQNPMKMKVTVSPNAPYGKYRVEVKAVNLQNYSRIGNLTFFAYVNVTKNIFRIDVSPSNLSSGPGQPASVYITINNTGISDEPFYIAAEGLPAWNVSDEIISLHSTKNRYTYSIFGNEPGIYNMNITVDSATSSLVSDSFPVRFEVKNSLLNDFNAVGNGVGLSPIIFEPSYAIMSGIYYIYSSLTGKSAKSH